MIKRYNFNGQYMEMEEDVHGEYVKFSNIETLIEALKEICEGSDCYSEKEDAIAREALKKIGIEY